MFSRHAHTSARVAFVNDLLLGAAPLSRGCLLLAGCNAGITPAQVHARVGGFFQGDSFGVHAAIVRRRKVASNGPTANVSTVETVAIHTGAPMTQEPKRPVANTRGAA